MYEKDTWGIMREMKLTSLNKYRARGFQLKIGDLSRKKVTRYGAKFMGKSPLNGKAPTRWPVRRRKRRIYVKMWGDGKKGVSYNGSAGI